MFKKKVIQTITAVALCFLLAGNSCFAAASSDSAQYTSAENVYAVLTADGSFENAYVINSFDVTQAGTITSYGNYDSLKNLTTLDEIQDQNDMQTFTAEEGKFYFQGNQETLSLPWKFSIRYLLDDTEVNAESLAGQSGSLEIILSIKKNKAVNSVFYDNYMLQSTFTLDMDTCSNILAEGASIAEAGSNKTVIFTSLPGENSEMHLTADVTDFEMSSISIAAVPFSMAFDMPDTDEMTNGLTELSEAIQELDEGVGELTEGMQTLKKNSGTLKDGSSTFSKGINTVSKNSDTLVDASSQIQSALQKVVNSLKKVDTSSLNNLSKLPDAFDELASALGKVESGVSSIPGMYAQVFQALSTAIEGLSGCVLSESELSALKEAAENGSAEAQMAYEKVKILNSGVSQLSQAQAGTEQIDGAVQTLASTINQLKSGIQQQSASLKSQLSSQDISSSLKTLQDGLGTLSKNYNSFHSGLEKYTDGVDTLASSYKKLDDGLDAYLSGVEKAADGTDKLKTGTNELALNTENIPEEVQEQIDEFMADYQYDFTPISFIDERNSNVNSVQFVISTPEITIPETEETEETAESSTGIIDRLKELFQ